MPRPTNAETELVHIGTLAERVGLSLRTVRYYEEIGLFEPAARSQGGFRLYGSEQEARVRGLRSMKPLGFSLDEMCDFVDPLNEVSRVEPDSRKVLVLHDRISNLQQEIHIRDTKLMKQIDATAQIMTALDSARESLN